MKIGILGGTFDPIHYAHLEIGKAAYEEYQLDELWFMPAGNPYFKKDKLVTPADVRLEMTKIALREYPETFKASDYEIRGAGASERTYTAETLEALHAERPGDSLYFILGLDSLMALNSWYRTEAILENAVVLYALRRGEMMNEGTAERAAEWLRNKYSDVHPQILRIHVPMMDISSTMIREMAKAGENIRPYVPDALAEYIERQGLYHHI